MDLLIKFIKNSLDNLIFLSLFISVISYWISIAFSTLKIGNKIGFLNVLISNVFITIGLLWRWIENGYFPLSNLYESLLFFTWGLTFIIVIVETTTSLTLVGAIATPLAMFIIGFATLSLPDGMQKAAPLVPALKSNWLMMHVSIMMFSYSTLIIGSLLSIVFLVLSRDKEVVLKGSSLGGNISTVQGNSVKSSFSELQYGVMNGILEKKLSLLETLDNLSYRIIGLGFPLLTIGIIAGAVWANEAWGSYWSWDPKETWALITWLVFAAYLHTRITRSWQGKGPAILASLGFIVVWVCYLGVNFLGKGLHSYGWIM
nr:cytochrome c biogenesis protein [Cryptomonas tetrapyrenoidosa]